MRCALLAGLSVFFVSLAAPPVIAATVPDSSRPQIAIEDIGNHLFDARVTGNTILSVAAGFNFFCALDSVGHVYCWGLNNAGQVGRGEPTGIEPVPALSSGVFDVTLGQYHACAM